MDESCSVKGCGVLIVIIISFLIIFKLFNACSSETADELYNEAKTYYNKKEYIEAKKLINKAIEKDRINEDFFALQKKINNKISGTEVYNSNSNPFLELTYNSSWLIKNEKHESLFLLFDKMLSDKELSDKVKLSLINSALKDFINADFNEKALVFVNNIDTSLFVNDTIKMEFLSKKAYIFYEIGDTINAIKAYKNYLDEYPKNKELLLGLITLYLESGDTINGMKGCKDYLNIYKDDRAVSIVLATIQIKKNKEKDAIGTLIKYLVYEPNDDYVHNMVGVLYYNVNNKRKAKYHFKKSAELGNEKGCQNYREITAKVRYYYTGAKICCDGWISYSSGRGTCSHHGGICKNEQKAEIIYTIECN